MCSQKCSIPQRRRHQRGGAARGSGRCGPALGRVRLGLPRPALRPGPAPEAVHVERQAAGLTLPSRGPETPEGGGLAAQTPISSVFLPPPLTVSVLIP